MVSGRLRSCSLMVLLAGLPLLSCGKHQYLAIPHANSDDRLTARVFDERGAAGSGRPTVTIAAGSPTLALGDSATVHVDFSAVADIELKQLVVLILNQNNKFSAYWELDLSPEELAARAADLELSALDEPPTATWCQRDNRGLGACANEVDDGAMSVMVVPANPTTLTWPGGFTALTLPAATSGGTSSSSCASFTKAQCCAGSAGISAVSCNIDKACVTCPAGTTKSGGVHADGTITCLCQ